MNAKLRPWVVGGALVCLLVLAAGWFLLVSPKRSEAASVRAKTTAQDAANQSLREQIAQLQQQARGLVAKQAELQNIGRRIPDSPQLPALIRALDGVRGRSGVDLVSLTPTAPAAAPAAVAGAAAYQAIPVSLTVRGDYSQMTLFLDELETLQRLYLVKSITLTPQGTKGGVVTLGPGGTPETPHTLGASVVGEVYTTSTDTTTLTLPALAPAGVATGAPASAPAAAATTPPAK